MISPAMKPEQDDHGRFVTGNIGGGRPKGARSKLGEDFLRALSSDFAEHGEKALIKVRETRPSDYLKVVASLMPKELDASDRMIDALSELLARVDGKTRTIQPVHDLVP